MLNQTQATRAAVCYKSNMAALLHDAYSYSYTLRSMAGRFALMESLLGGVEPPADRWSSGEEVEALLKEGVPCRSEDGN